MGGRLANNKMGIVGGEIERLVGGQEGFLVDTGGLGFIQRDEHCDRGVQGLLHEDVVQLGVVEAEHVEVKRDRDAGQNVLENVVDVVATDVEKMNILAGDGGVRAFFCILREIRQGKRLQALCWITEHVAWALCCGLCVVSLNGCQSGRFCVDCFGNCLTANDVRIEERPCRRGRCEGQGGTLCQGCRFGGGLGFLRFLRGHAAFLSLLAGKL